MHLLLNVARQGRLERLHGALLQRLQAADRPCQTSDTKREVTAAHEARNGRNGRTSIPK